MECNGLGHCLALKDLLCKYKCKPESCPNFKICDSYLPRYMMDLNNGVCNICIYCIPVTNNSQYVLYFEEEKNWSCPICYEICSQSVRIPKCRHKVCSDCFKKIFFPEYQEEFFQDAPKFPYPDKEDDYYSTMSVVDDFLSINDRNIIKWKKEQHLWNLEKRKQLSSLRFIRHCPICRM